jgi:hypothetical protein
MPSRLLVSRPFGFLPARNSGFLGAFLQPLLGHFFRSRVTAFSPKDSGGILLFTFLLTLWHRGQNYLSTAVFPSCLASSILYKIQKAGTLVKKTLILSGLHELTKLQVATSSFVLYIPLSTLQESYLMSPANFSLDIVSRSWDTFTSCAYALETLPHEKESRYPICIADADDRLHHSAAAPQNPSSGGRRRRRSSAAVSHQDLPPAINCSRRKAA